jgi:hypothetical protein
MQYIIWKSKLLYFQIIIISVQDISGSRWERLKRILIYKNLYLPKSKESSFDHWENDKNANSPYNLLATKENQMQINVI